MMKIPKTPILLRIGVLFFSFFGAQNTYSQEADDLPASFFKANREALREKLTANSCAVFFAASNKVRSNDVNYEYHQDPNFYYFTGLKESNALLIVTKDIVQINDSIRGSTFLYIEKKGNDELWNGKRLGIERAQKTLGIQHVISSASFDNTGPDFSKFKTIYALPLIDERVADDKENKGDLASLKKHFFLKILKLNDEILDKEHLSEYCAELREIKHSEELRLLRKAIEITCEAQNKIMQRLSPGLKEYQIEATSEFEFKDHGAEYPGFPSIHGGGANSCVLHYYTNREVLDFDDVLVNDIGAEYHGYTADITRTFPVSGEFSEEQKIIYNIVLKAQEKGIEASRAGAKFWAPHKAAVKVISEELMALGLIEKPYEYKKYFMHGTSHYLGLDVHDPGTYNILQVNNVITVEPGVYIPENSDCDPRWWNIGVRIEDDVLITDGDPEVLSDCVVKDIKAIEGAMKKR